MQGRALPMAAPTVELMDQQYTLFESQHKNLVDEAIKAQFELLQYVERSRIVSETAFAALRDHEWERLALIDRDKLSMLGEFLEQADATIPEQAIREQATDCFTYSIAVGLANDTLAR